MTTMELEKRKSILQKIISQLKTDEDISYVEKYISTLLMQQQQQQQQPCQYTIEELKKHLEEAEEDIRAGRVFTTEDVRSHFHQKYNL